MDQHSRSDTPKRTGIVAPARIEHERELAVVVRRVDLREAHKDLVRWWDHPHRHQRSAASPSVTPRAPTSHPLNLPPQHALEARQLRPVQRALPLELAQLALLFRAQGARVTPRPCELGVERRRAVAQAGEVSRDGLDAVREVEKGCALGLEGWRWQ